MAGHIEKAAAHHTNLSVFACIVGILETSVLTESKSAADTARKIIRLCNDEQQRQLRAYDFERASAQGGGR